MVGNSLIVVIFAKVLIVCIYAEIRLYKHCTAVYTLLLYTQYYCEHCFTVRIKTYVGFIQKLVEHLLVPLEQTLNVFLKDLLLLFTVQ